MPSGWRLMKVHIKKHSWILEISPYLIVAQEKQQPSRNTKEFKGRYKERRRLYKPDKKHDQLRSKAIKEHEDLVRSARFEQIWKKRKNIDAEECFWHEKCHLYDVVRVDAEDERVPKPKGAPEVDGAIWDKYLPLLREFLPQAAKEIEHDKATKTKEGKFVYDIYTVGIGVNMDMDNTDEYPLVQVYMEDDYYDGSSRFDYESDDSNAENNPWNDYRDEESSEDDDEDDNETTLISCAPYPARRVRDAHRSPSFTSAPPAPAEFWPASAAGRRRWRAKFRPVPAAIRPATGRGMAGRNSAGDRPGNGRTPAALAGQNSAGAGRNPAGDRPGNGQRRRPAALAGQNSVAAGRNSVGDRPGYGRTRRPAIPWPVAGRITAGAGGAEVRDRLRVGVAHMLRGVRSAGDQLAIMKILLLTLKILTQTMNKKLLVKRKIERIGDGNIVKFGCFAC